MNELPESWTTAPLSAISSDVPQRVPGETETFTYIDIGSVDRGTKTITTPQVLLGKDAPSRARKQVATGDTLVSMTRPNLNAVALVPPSLDGQIASTGFDVLRPLDGIDPRWLAYLVRTEQFVSAMSDLVQGALYPAVRTKDVRAYVAPVAPSAEQTRIADQLDTLLARINACHHRLDTIPALLKRFRLAVLNAAVSGDLTSDWRALNEGQPWTQTTIGEMTQSSYYGPRFGKDEYTHSASGIPTIRTTDMDRVGRIHVSVETPRVVVPKDKIEQFRVKPGDLLVTRTGSIGVMAVFDGNYLAIPSAYLIRFRFSSSLRTRFAYYRLASPKGQAELGLSATAVTQPNVNAEAIKRIQLELPTVEEQDEIIRRVERLYSFADRIESSYMAVVAHAQRLSPLTLAKAFRGELVQQNPQDEPASVLLQRIAGRPTEKLKTTRGRPRVKKPETDVFNPVALPDWSTLPAGAWAAQVPADEHTATAQLTAVLKAWNKGMPQDAARLATLLCLQPRLLTAALPADHAAQWRRLVGDAAAPLPAQVVTLQPAFNTPWRNAISKMRARGDLVETGSGAQGTWALGPDAGRVDTAGWPDGRAGWVVHYLQTHGVEAVLPSLAAEVQEFVHARAA